jgi:hypothetical protein
MQRKIAILNMKQLDFNFKNGKFISIFQKIMNLQLGKIHG